MRGGNRCVMGIRVRWPIDSCARFGFVGLRFLPLAWRHGDFYARVAIRRYMVGTIRLKKMPPTWAARLEEATMVDEAQLSKAVAALTAGKPVVSQPIPDMGSASPSVSRVLPRLFLLINVAIPTKLFRGLLALLRRLRAMAATCRSSRTIWFRSFGLGLLRSW